jgi:fatty-acyl-CoA synthase
MHWNPTLSANPYETDLDRNPANYQPLTPLAHLERAALIHPDHLAIIHGSMRVTYRHFLERSRQLANALTGLGISKGDTVSVMLSNTPAMLEAHHGVPMIGAVLHSINTRLDAQAIAFQLDHADCKVLIVDREFSAVMAEALALAAVKPLVIDYDDTEYPDDAPFPKGARIGSHDYDEFVVAAIPGVHPNPARRRMGGRLAELHVRHHRQSEGRRLPSPRRRLMGYSNVIASGMGRHPVYLWTLPMFHCNGWCFPWTLGVVAGTHVCLRWVRARAMYDAIADHGVTHLCGAPIVMATLLNAPDEEKREFDQTVSFNTAAAPPPEAVLAGMADAGFEVVHLYGLTETYGPAVVNEWKAEWSDLERGARSTKKARQGVRYPALEDLAVMDPETMEKVPADGETIGEVMFRGNIVMKGYLKNPAASAEAFRGGWFHSGDLGVMHPDGYLQLKDRSKDIIISGGENISSIEVEDALYKHPGIMAAAVVARPDDKWGETPCAFVELRPGYDLSEEDVIEHCRSLLARFKCPRTVIFHEVPKTSTGKIQKYLLRDEAKTLGSS